MKVLMAALAVASAGTAGLVYAQGAGSSGEGAASRDTYMICIRDSGRMAKHAGCTNIRPVGDDQACSGPNNEACSTTTLQDLCRQIGGLTGDDFTEFSSGYGTFKTMAECTAKCETAYAGRFAQFGGTCAGDVTRKLAD